jgi:hypothetical protein
MDIIYLGVGGEELEEALHTRVGHLADAQRTAPDGLYRLCHEFLVLAVHVRLEDTQRYIQNAFEEAEAEARGDAR